MASRGKILIFVGVCSVTVQMFGLSLDLSRFVFMCFFKIIAAGSKFEVCFFGDRTTAKVGKKAVKSFGSVNVQQHLHKKGYKKALQEALITMARREKKTTVPAIGACNELKNSHVGTSALCDTVACNNKKSKSASDVQSALVQSRNTRNTRSSQTLVTPEPNPAIHIKKKTIKKREMKKMKNSVRRSERLRKKK